MNDTAAELTDLEIISCILRLAKIPHRIDWDIRIDWYGDRYHTGVATLIVDWRFGFMFESGRLVPRYTEAWPESLRESAI
jgi:hypothetical protein